jgi:hypothetical protein
MALVSKAKAAKLAGVSRTTIHRYASTGKLSMSGDHVDTSELIRVFGQIREHGWTPEQVNTTGQPVTEGGQGKNDALISLLEDQIKDLRQDRDHWRGKSDQLTELLKTEQENIRLITHQGKTDKESPLLAGAVLALIMACIVVVGWSLYQITQ